MVIILIFTFNYTIGQNNVIEHKVKSGEYLSLIANKYDITVSDLKEYNGLTTNMIYVDQILLIPSKDDYSPSFQYSMYDNLNMNERACLKYYYDSQLGVRELTGNNDGFMVEKYLKSAGLGKGYAWCASFVNWVYFQCGDTLKLSSPAWVPSYFPRSRLIYVRGGFQTRQPVFGDLIGIYFQSKGRLAHIGFYDGENSEYYFTVEGNTNEEGSREGDGVYRKRRIKRQVHSISSWVEK